jgi:hypothetical protein
MYDDALGCLVPFCDLSGSGELEPDRPHPHRYPTAVPVIAERLRQLGTWQAAGHQGNVAEELPHLAYRLRDLKVVADQHRVSFLTYEAGLDSNRARQPGEQK